MPLDSDIRVAVLKGGISSEREVSLRTGEAVEAALRRKGYNTIGIDVKEDISDVLWRTKPDVAFNGLHGKYGEDGTIQGLLELLKIPYTGSGVLASALAMDKILSKRLFMAEGIPVAPYQVVQSSALDETLSRLQTYKLPVIVKPRAEGSSVGVTLVKEHAQLPAALDSAFDYDDAVLIESYIKGREIQIGVLERQVLGAIEVKPSNEFYDYEAKYTAGKTQYIASPDMPSDVYEKMADYSLRAVDAFNCEGAVRVDFILSEDNVPYILEVNTLPGMTELSLLPKIAAQAGIQFDDLVETLLLGARLKL
jgi:D-alanine-D-alanine ligase